MDHHGTRRGPTENKRMEFPSQIHITPLFQFHPLVSPFHPPFRNTQSCGGFETPGIGRRVGYWGGGGSQRSKRTAAETGGASRNLTGPYGAPTVGNYARKSSDSSRFCALTHLVPPSIQRSQYPTFRRFRNAWFGRRGGIEAKRKAIGHNGPPRNMATPHATMENGATGRTGHRGTWRGHEEPGGTPRNTNRWVLHPPKSTFFAFFALSPIWTPHTPPTPNVSVVSKRLV